MHEGRRFGPATLPFPTARERASTMVSGSQGDRYIAWVNRRGLIAIAHDARGRPATFVVNGVEKSICIRALGTECLLHSQDAAYTAFPIPWCGGKHQARKSAPGRSIALRCNAMR
jgi:hypothetical protein